MGNYYYQTTKSLFKLSIKQGIVWMLVLTLFGFIRYFHTDADADYYIDVEIINNFTVPVVLLIGFFNGVVLTYLEAHFLNTYAHRGSLGYIIFLGILLYICFVTAVLFVTYSLTVWETNQQFTLGNLKRFFLNGTSISFIIYLLIATFIFGFFKQVDRKFGPGNLMRMLRGDFYYPKEENRIFMFLDLNSSTTIAEDLGHIRYSRLLQDCFHDVSIVQKYKAEFYQYVGDEVVLTWNLKNGVINNNVIKAYYAFIDLLESKRDYYVKNYGLMPEFKAGVHYGKVTVTEVGDVKREIAFHGDVLNTASRIQGKCNEIGELFLVSGDVAALIGAVEGAKLQSISEVTLKGKNKQIEIFAVKRQKENPQTELALEH
ncbi:adenylate/guanylate cyclase domain-containing protein [Chondrinema litorale]|uniref:adenylate/guanylate cyclase domain-containing protein n=1 Tax=Chondrinema litorale TaxID=2994555 RepID=UPI0025437B8D|nr:adenylate/guanylate cyclase domain-containing protein [Chondrinema litorale]UZR96540.1 adenylate/guanylate cyclase domain-containing protein [Chondrinema litorale]